MKCGALLVLTALTATAAPYPDRFVWVFGWGLGRDSDVAEISRVLDTAGANGFNGAVVSFGLDTLCKQSPDYFRRLGDVQQACRKNNLELIPAVFSIGYGGGILSHDRNFAEGVPVEDAPFVVQSGQARLIPNSAPFLNGGFEEFTGNKIARYDMLDQPGEISFVDTETKHSGKASLRMENFTANPHGHGRVMQTIKLQPHRCYRLTLWVKTENLQPPRSFRVSALVGDQSIAPRDFNIPATTDWRKITMLINSLDFDRVRLYAGVWGAKSGKFWLDDWSVEEVGPVKVLHRPGTPVAVRSADGAITYTEAKDYAPLEDPQQNRWRDDGEPATLKILPGSRIHDGDRLRVSWFHSMVINDSQVTVCMAEPAVYEIFDHESKLLAQHLHPRKVFLNMDEIRMGGTCAACRGQNMGELLGRCITRQCQLIRKYSPDATIYVWSDMLDPNHNAHDKYFLVRGDFTGSWDHVPKDIIMAVWGGAVREKDLRFATSHGFQSLVACYYDANDLTDVKDWLALARQLPNIRGFMYTPWQKKYDLLPGFGQLLQ